MLISFYTDIQLIQIFQKRLKKRIFLYFKAAVRKCSEKNSWLDHH